MAGRFGCGLGQTAREVEPMVGVVVGAVAAVVVALAVAAAVAVLIPLVEQQSLVWSLVASAGLISSSSSISAGALWPRPLPWP